MWGGLRTVGNLFDLATSGVRLRREDAEQSSERAQADLSKSFSDTWQGVKGVFSSFSTDRSLDDIQSGDINLKDYRDPKKVFTDALDATKKQVEIESEKYRKSLPAKKSIILNPDIKTDKALVEQVKSAIIASGGVPQADTYINIVDVSNGMANIKYQAVTDQETAKGGLKKYTLEKDISIPVSNLPPSMLNRLEGDLPSYVNSIKNPTKTIRNISYTPPENYNSKSQFEQDFIRTSGGSLSEADLQYARLNGIESVKTKEDFLKEISLLPVEIVSAFRQDLDSKYNVVWERPEGGGAFIGRLMKNGEEVMRQNVQEDFKPHTFKGYTVKYVNSYLEQQIKDLQTAYRRSKQ